MFKAPLYFICNGTCCQAIENGQDITLIAREDGRILRRKIGKASGKQYGARTVSYADAYFEFPFGTVEILGEEMTYETKTVTTEDAASQ